MHQGQPGDARRRVPIDWDELEIAMTWNSDEWHAYLDIRTGQVHRSRSQAFVDEGEDDELSAEELEDGLADGVLLPIDPIPSSDEYRWMEAFAGSVTDVTLRRLLEIALGGRGAFRRFKSALADYPADRERWFRFKDERVREAMRAWLADNNLEPATDPPARGG